MRRDDPGPYSLDTLRSIGAPDLFTRDAAVLKARYVAWFEAASGRTLYPMQVEMLLIEALAYAMSLMGEEAQMHVEQHLVAFASAEGLERLGPNRSTPRLPAAKARVTVRFAIPAIRPDSVLIPEGSRVSAGGIGAVFLTLAPTIIAAGQLHADVVLEAEAAGAGANGFIPGQITTQLDPIAGVTASNIDISSGGADIEDVEAWRLRMANAYDRISPGGGRGWYRETAMGVSSAIIDVAVLRPAPCYVEVYPLTASGPASPELRAQVLAVLAAPASLDIRFGDAVSVLPPVAVESSLTMTVRVRGATSGITAAVEAAIMPALDEWSQRLGSDIAPSRLEQLARSVTGVIDAACDLPFHALAGHQYLQFTAVSIVVEVL